MATRRRRGFGAAPLAVPKRSLDTEFILPTHRLPPHPYRDEECPRCGRALRIVWRECGELALDVETKRVLQKSTLVLEHTPALCESYRGRGRGHPTGV